MKRRKAYGLPYKGSKNRIAEWVVDSLPAADTLVDLFAGGCAVSHCAMLSGKFNRVIANDISDAPEVFADAVNGNIDLSGFPLTRDEFKESTDTLSRLVYSYGNDQRSYIYGAEREDVCIAAERMMYGATVAGSTRRIGSLLRYFRVICNVGIILIAKCRDYRLLRLLHVCRIFMERVRRLSLKRRGAIIVILTFPMVPLCMLTRHIMERR